jgi:hypothetical protein
VGLGEQAREETQDREQRDREDRRRGWRGSETVGDERRNGFQPAIQKFERLLSTKVSTTIGVRKRTPPRIVVPTKCDSVFIRASTVGLMSDGLVREVAVGSKLDEHQSPVAGRL